MRRVVCDYIAAAITCAQPRFEEFIAQHLQCPAPVPLAFTGSVASIREIRQLSSRLDSAQYYPPVDVVVAMRVSLTARARRRGV